MSNQQNRPNASGFWNQAIGVLLRELSPQQFKTWNEPLRLIVCDNELT